MREYNLDVDYVEIVSKEDLDRYTQDKDVKKKDGTQPKKYYKNLSKDVKDKKADHFKNRDTTKNDNRPAASAKINLVFIQRQNKNLSVHTKKFKQMYGEKLDKIKNAYDIDTRLYSTRCISNSRQDGYDPNYQGGKYTNLQ